MSEQRDALNYYEILEVSPDAPGYEIQKAYQRAKATYSADSPALYSMFSREEATELLRMIEEAYTVLSNHALRKTYDESLAGKTATARRHNDHSPVLEPEPVESQHKALPDFPVPEAVPVSHKFDRPGAKLPPGMGKTGASTYRIDTNIEDEIAAMTEFDGPCLQKIRLYKNISLERMSDLTRVSRTYLTAIEDNDYTSLPAAVFVRGFVVHMARILGLDENKVAASYMKMFKAGGGK